MTDKNMESLIKKIVKKLVNKEIAKLQAKSNITLNTTLNPDNLPILSNDINSNDHNSSIDPFLETISFWKDELNHEEMADDIYSNASDNLPTPEDVELERKLREMKFKQELRKDWILFLLKDVIVYSVTIIFIFIVAGFYLQQILSE